MAFINKDLSVYPLSFTRLFPLALLLCVTACGGKKDLASKPITITPNERVIASSVPNEPPIIILSPTSANTTAYYQPVRAVPQRKKREQASAPISNNTANISSTNQGNYAVQIGAFSSDTLANRAANQARQGASSLLSSAKTHIDTISKDGRPLYLVKLTGISEITASQACSELKQKQIPCIITR